MIFTDGPFITYVDLDRIDGEFSSIANKQSVVVDGSPDSIIYTSTMDAGSTLIAKLQSFGGTLNWVGIDSNNAATVVITGLTSVNRPRVVLSQVIVLEPNPMRRVMKRWVSYYTLFNFYRMIALRRTGEDRFADKTNMYDAEQERQWGVLKSIGIPVVITPFPSPGAIWEYGSGTWGTSNVTAISGGSAPSTVVYNVSITWVNNQNYISPTNQSGGESGGSQPVSVTVGTNKVININITSLNPPQGSVQSSIGVADGICPVQQPTGWNIYVGVVGGPLYLQNSSPIGISTLTYTFTGAPVATGFVQNEGQPAQYNITLQKTLYRGA